MATTEERQELELRGAAVQAALAWNANKGDKNTQDVLADAQKLYEFIKGGSKVENNPQAPRDGDVESPKGALNG